MKPATLLAVAVLTAASGTAPASALPRRHPDPSEFVARVDIHRD